MASRISPRSSRPTSAFVEDQLREHAKPTVKQRLAALRMLFDWMVVCAGQNTHGERVRLRCLRREQARTLLDSIDTASVHCLRDRALIVLLTYTFARVGAALAMRVEDYFVQGEPRLHEKGGKGHEMPTHHNLDEYVEAHTAGAGIANDRIGSRFRTSKRRGGELANRIMRHPMCGT